MAVIGITQQCVGLGIDRDRRAARGAIDPRGHAVVAIARILRLDASHIGYRGFGQRARAAFVVVPDLQLVRRGHCVKAEAE
jgi:hypothetical protein